MKKTLVCAACAAALLLATSANAQTNDPFPPAEDSAGVAAPVTTVIYPADGPKLNGVVRINGEARAAVAPTGPATPPTAAQLIKVLPPPPQRKTNREIIERIRSGAPIQRPGDAVHVDAEGNAIPARGFVNIDGSTTGQISVFRQENGQVVEDRTISVQPGSPGKPLFFRSSTTVGAGLRVDASTTGQAWLTSREFNVDFSNDSSTTLSNAGKFRISIAQKQQPINQFFSKIFDLFRKAGGSQQ